jgi:hypothetical protein
MSYAEVIVGVPDCVVMVYDRASPINSEGLAGEVLREARWRAGHAGNVAAQWRNLLAPFVNAGSLAYWLTFLDGVYKIAVQAGAPFASAPLNERFGLGNDARLTTLNCASGDIVVGTMSDLIENKGRHVLSVDRGKYLVGISGNAAEEKKHELLEDIADYPPNDGPDWTISLWSLTP